MILNYDAAGQMRLAVLNAAEAAREVLESFPRAGRLTFSYYGLQPQNVRPLRLWALFDRVGEEIWAYSDEHSDALMRQDLIVERLHDAATACRDMFINREPSLAELRLDIEAVLDLDADLAAGRLADHAHDDMGTSEMAMRDLMHDVANEGASKVLNGKDWSPLSEDAVHELLRDAASERAANANNEGLEAQARFLLEELGEVAAWSAIEDAA